MLWLWLAEISEHFKSHVISHIPKFFSHALQKSGIAQNHKCTKLHIYLLHNITLTKNSTLHKCHKLTYHTLLTRLSKSQSFSFSHIVLICISDIQNISKALNVINIHSSYSLSIDIKHQQQ